MKKTLRTLMMGMMALLGCTALTSCSNDDEPQVAQQEGQKGYVEFTLSRGADTRTAYAAKDGGLNVTWSDGDKMVVLYGLGTTDEIVEVFGLVSGEGTTKATFAKSDSNLKGKSGTVSLEYLPGINETNYKTQVFDFSEQSGSLENFADYDAFAFSANLTNGIITEAEYQAVMAVYHFKAEDINFGVSDAKVDFIFAGGTNAFAWDGPKKGSIIVKGVSLTGGKLDKDLYVVVYASQAPTTLTIGSQTFALPTDKLEAGKMYTFAQKDLIVYQAPLTIKAIEAGTITISNPLGLVISYQKNGGEKVTSTKDDTSDIGIPVVAGDEVQLFGENASYADISNYTNIQSSAACKVYGNIMSLIDRNKYSTLTAFGDGTSYNFANLFKDNTKLTDASGLILPATTLAVRCYESMFEGCTSLTAAPALGATTLARRCYESMYEGCTSLKAAPALNATTLANFCYAFMFKGCTALTEAPALPATTLTESCYSYMFQGCTALTEAPALLATTLAVDCYDSMFYNCTALTEAPALPATTLADYCYSNMFQNCTLLTAAPALPATTLANHCYSNMFNGCTLLTKAPLLSATTLKDYCYSSMFDGCTSLTEAPALNATTLTVSCYSNMFKGCTSLTEAPTLPATTLVEDCYYHMFDGCTKLSSVTCLATDITASGTVSWLYHVASTGTFTKAASMESWQEGKDGIPSGWSVKN